MSPIFEYTCTACGVITEGVVKYEERLTTPPCNACGGATEFGLSAPTIHQPYAMGAVLENGAHVKGHFGKEAKRNRKKC